MVAPWGAWFLAGSLLRSRNGEAGMRFEQQIPAATRR